MAAAKPRIYVLAGVNGAGKSSVVGATIRDKGGEYYNPDEAARAVLSFHPGLDQTQANAVAWEQGRLLLRRAIDEGLDFTFETTLGGNTMPALLAEAAGRGIEVRLSFIGLERPRRPYRTSVSAGPRRWTRHPRARHPPPVSTPPISK
jgi:predicted ABC-type ATPase